MRNPYKEPDKVEKPVTSDKPEGYCRFKVGLDMVLVEMFPHLDKIGQLHLPNNTQLMKAVKGVIRSIGSQVKDWKVGDVAVLSPNQGGMIRDGERSYRVLPQSLIICVDIELTKKGWRGAVDADKDEVHKKFQSHDGNKLQSEKI